MLIRPTLTLQKGALLLKGALLALLIVAIVLLTLAIRNNPLIQGFKAAELVAYLMAIVFVVQVIELVAVRPATNAKVFGVYKTLTAVGSALAFVVLYAPLGISFTLALQIAVALIILVTIIDGAESLYI